MTSIRIADRAVGDGHTCFVIAEAGVNQALLFRYFGSKDALFAAIMAGASGYVLKDSDGDEILYAVDYNRGIDILRYTGKL